MRLIKSALCILVIFALAVSLVPTTASASALTVVGTSFSSAGLTSAEFAASAGPYAIGILAALAAAFGIKAYTQTDTGQAAKNFYQDLIEERAAETRRSVAEEMEILLGNATIGEQGNIVLGRLSYAEAKEILMRNEIPIEVPSETISLKGFTFGFSMDYVFIHEQPYEETVYYNGNKTYTMDNLIFRDSDNGYECIAYQGSGQGNVSQYIKRESLLTGNIINISNYTVYGFDVGNTHYTIRRFAAYGSNANLPSNSLSALTGGTYTQDDLIINVPDDTLYGVDETLRDQNVGLNEGLVLAPDLINSAVLGGATGQISASDYCGALVDYVSGYDTVIDGVTVTGLPEAGTVPRSIDEAPTSDTVIDEAPPSTMTGTEAAGLYSFSLDELFPFCLPFDFVRIIEKFNVQPEAPNFDWRFYIPGVIDYTLHIDLSAWNTAAEVCRTMVLIAFMVGLIMLTRQIFIRA